MEIKKRHLKRLNEITKEKEIWKPINGFTNYLISTAGRVYSFNKNDILLPETTVSGYLRVKLFNDGEIKKIKVHRLVAEAFLEQVEGKPQVDHKNGVKIDNRIQNLRYVNNSENQLASVQKGCRKTKTNTMARHRLKVRRQKFEEIHEKEIQKIRDRDIKKK